MGTTQNKNNGLEEARYEIEKSKIVVHGAKITCDYSVTGKVDNYLSVTDGHGIMENGKNCAHDESCIPMKNIQPFKACKSPDVETALKELSVNASAGDKTRYEAALKVIADNRLARKDKEVPCTIPLLDRWFDGDEREIVTDSMMMGVELKGNLAAIQSTISNDLSTKGFYYLQLSKDRELSKEKRDACKELGNKIIKDKETINEIFRYIYDELNTRIQIEGDDFSDIKGELKDVKGKVESIRDICINVEANYTELDNYESYKDSLDTYIEELKNIIDRLNNWKEKEYHLITTDSFLVCRCGGIITIEDSGQDYGELVEMLHANLLTVLSQFKEHCKTQSDYEVDETMYYLGLERNSYKAALKGLGDFEKLMIGDDGGKETGDVSVYLELICHSYNDEMSKTMMSILALISLKVPVLSFLLGFYSTVGVEDTAQGAVDMTSGYVSMAESIGETVSNIGGALVVEMNNLYTIVSSIVNLFYVSYDTWIETVRITVFTDTHAHTCERWIDKSGELKGERNTVGIYSKNDYISGDIGRGLKWEEEPGTYMRNLVHKGDNWEEGKEVNEEEGLRGEVPLY